MNAKPILVVACAVALAVTPTASAAIVPGVAVDGPSAAIEGGQGVQVDVAPDGTAALAYLKAEGGENHVFVSQFSGGAWDPPFQADTGSDTAASALRLAVANGGKIVVTFKLATGAVVSRIKPNAAAPFGADQTVLAGAEYANVDLAPNGNGYAVGQASNNVFARRLEGETWSDVASGNPLDNDPTQEAGGSDNNIRVATAPDGASAVATWGEAVATGGTDVFARRLSGRAAGPAAAAHLDSFPGGDVPTDPQASQPDVGIDGAGTGWVVFRNAVLYGMTNRPRAVARPLTGDAFGAFQIIDGAPEPPTEGRDFTRVSVNSAGQGLAAHHGNTTNGAEFASLAGGNWTRGAPVTTEANDLVPFALPAMGENGSGLLTWIHGPAATARMLARTTFGGLGAIQTLSNPAFGPASGQPDAAAGAGAFAAVTFVQVQGMAGFRVVASIVDLPQPPQQPQPPPPAVNGDEDPPDVTGLRMDKRFRKGGGLPAASQVRTGTRIRYRLSEAASVTLSFARATPGRRVGGRCVKRTRRNRGRRPCTRYVRVRPALRFANQQAGARQVRFAGRLNRRRSLRPGRHRLTLRARDAASNVSRPARVRFRLLPRR